MKKLKKGIKGITLVALVVTIIVLLILAGITINLILGDNGLIKRAEQARNRYINATEKEWADLDEMYSSIEIATNGDGKVTLDKEQLSQYINGVVEEKMEGYKSTIQNLQTKVVEQNETIQNLNSKVTSLENQRLDNRFIDTNNLIDEIGDNSKMEDVSRSYTAKQDCAVIWWVQTANNGAVAFRLNGVAVGGTWSKYDTNRTSIFYLKSGDKLEFNKVAEVGGTVGIKFWIFGLK